MEDITVFVDESGNPGRGRGRYFTIACVVVDSCKAKKLRRKMKKVCGHVKKQSPDKTWPRGEVKASAVSIDERCEIIKRLPQSDVSIHYVTVDKHHVVDRMFIDSCLSYNYWLRLVIDNVLENNPDCKKITMCIDRRDIKVSSGNSFRDYITIHECYEMERNLEIVTNYPESHNDYGIQIADFIANGINYHYITKKESIKLILQPMVVSREKFPRYKFNK